MSQDDTTPVDPGIPNGEVVDGVAEGSVDDLSSLLSPEEQEMLTLRVERDDYLDTLRRLQADFDNFRKRALRDQDAAAERAGERLVTKLLPVLDTFELAMSHAAADGVAVDDSPMAKLHDSLLSALESEGLERLAPAGESFDPSVADAVVHEEADDSDVASDGPVVSEVLRAGYRWKTKVVRPAMVKVRG